MQNAQLSDAEIHDAKQNGVVYTPPEIAAEVMRYLANDISVVGERILEPSCGDGSFIQCVQRYFPNSEIDALDIDPAAITACSAATNGVSFECKDFFDFIDELPDQKYDLVVGNPPYIRTSNFSKKLKSQLDQIADAIDFPRGQLKNSWAAFILLSETLLQPRGTLAFVVPYELITVSYGKALIEHLSKRFERIDVFVPDEKAFTQIDQDAVLILAHKSATNLKGLNLNKVKSLSKLEVLKSSTVPAQSKVSNSTLMKSFLLEPDQLELLHKIRTSVGQIGSVCSSAAGTVTAANRFFILSEGELQKHQLDTYAKPIVQKASDIPFGTAFTDKDFGRLSETGKPCYLIDLSNISEEELTEAAQAYLATGETLGIDQRYKCRHRTPWYRVPIVPASDGFFFKRSHLVPRICNNLAGVLTTDTAYQIRMKPGHRIGDLCTSFYNSLTLTFAEIDGRFYGGGVLELTPKEFRGLPLVMLPSSDNQRKKLESVSASKPDKYAEILATADQVVRSHLNLDQAAWNRLQLAYSTIRNHRLRHGSKATVRDFREYSNAP